MPFPPVYISVLAEEHLADVGIAGLGGKVESGPDMWKVHYTEISWFLRQMFISWTAEEQDFYPPPQILNI